MGMNGGSTHISASELVDAILKASGTRNVRENCVSDVANFLKTASASKPGKSVEYLYGP